MSEGSEQCAIVGIPPEHLFAIASAYNNNVRSLSDRVKKEAVTETPIDLGITSEDIQPTDEFYLLKKDVIDIATVVLNHPTRIDQQSASSSIYLQVLPASLFEDGNPMLPNISLALSSVNGNFYLDVWYNDVGGNIMSGNKTVHFRFLNIEELNDVNNSPNIFVEYGLNSDDGLQPFKLSDNSIVFLRNILSMVERYQKKLIDNTGGEVIMSIMK